MDNKVFKDLKKEAKKDARPSRKHKYIYQGKSDDYEGLSEDYPFNWYLGGKIMRFLLKGIVCQFYKI